MPETVLAAGAEEAGGAAVAGAAATDVAATAGVAGGTAAAGAGTAAGAAYGAETAATFGAGTSGGSFLGNAGASLAVNAGTQVVSSLLNPKAKSSPTVAPVIGMPDPLAQQEAIKQSLIEQMARRGRASTILTDSPSSGTLGG